MNYTEEEIAALPSTDTVFDQPTLDMNAHTWIQQGYMLSDACNPHTISCQHVGIPIKPGQMLVGKKGAYSLIDEQ